MIQVVCKYKKKSKWPKLLFACFGGFVIERLGFCILSFRQTHPLRGQKCKCWEVVSLWTSLFLKYISKVRMKLKQLVVNSHKGTFIWLRFHQQNLFKCYPQTFVSGPQRTGWNLQNHVFTSQCKWGIASKPFLYYCACKKTTEKGREMITDIQYLHFTMAFKHVTVMQINTLHLGFTNGINI